MADQNHPRVENLVPHDYETLRLQDGHLASTEDVSLSNPRNARAGGDSYGGIYSDQEG